MTIKQHRPELTGAPNIFVTTKRLSPGKQRVTIEWKYIKHDYVDGYLVTIQRLPSGCNYNITLTTTNTSLHIDLSVAFFNVFLSAYNKAGSSALVSSVVHPLSMADFPGQIFATHTNSTIFLTWRPLFQCDFVVINWGTSYLAMESKTVMDRIANYSIPGPFHRMERYRIMLYIYDSCQCQDSRKETTFGITSIYPEEGVPRTGPSNITVRNVTKTSAVMEWGNIPEEDCLGFLLGYRIYCTDISRNTTLEMFVDFSSERSHMLLGLTSGSVYKVAVSGVTSKGTGAPSASLQFTTLSYAEAEFQSIIISTCGGIIVTAVLVSVCVYAIHRKKKNLYFPKIPNPKHSNVMRADEEAPTKVKLLELLQSHESSCDSAGVEVIEQIPIVTLPQESCMQVRETCTMKNTPQTKKTPAQAPNAKDYTSMMSMINALKKMPQTKCDQ
ncbi:leukemia inhibitory factor receptor-like [Pseudophryne corroboree]|uniref:leukemia inhibitory factor receptor-like n=1 Tax=Pseudophryne corroboree TaxID=495146 RepID=UPI003081724D